MKHRPIRPKWVVERRLKRAVALTRRLRGELAVHSAGSADEAVARRIAAKIGVSIETARMKVAVAKQRLDCVVYLEAARADPSVPLDVRIGGLLDELRQHHPDLSISRSGLYRWSRRWFLRFDLVDLVDPRGGPAARATWRHRRRGNFPTVAGRIGLITAPR